MPAVRETTPCPIQVSFAQHPPRQAASDETGENVDFTFDLQAAFKQAAPRRRKPRPQNGVVRIFEDGAESEGLQVGVGGGVSKLAERIDTDESRRKNRPTSQRRDMMAAPPTRACTVAAPRNEEVQVRVQRLQKEEITEQGRRGPLRKEPRRRTIYVPSEDTTILTIHPGSHHTSHSQTELATQNMAHSLMQSGRTKIRQSLAAAPRRAPLQTALQKLQENNISRFDVPGRPTGKENIPPGSVPLMRKEHGTKSTIANNAICRRKPSLVSNTKTLVPPHMRIASNFRRNGDSLDGHLPKQSEKRSAIRANLSPVNDFCPKRIPDKLIKPVVQLSRKLPIAYVLLDEDISHPQMYEENWLNNQETAITELINSLFKTTNSAHPDAALRPDSLRHDLMQLYQQSSVLFLYKRIEASLNFGALRPSTDSMMETCRLLNDVGTRQRFKDLWMKTYDIELLRCAAEVVVGREAPFSPMSEISHPRNDARSLEIFIEACLLRNEDTAPPKQVASNAPSWSWRRTVQRSLMLVLLLDMAKETNIITSNLFQATSTHKSSSAVLRELTCLLVPSGGDLGRPLAHLDYHLTHVQYPLSEYNYTIETLAVDLRDGIRLAHLVEILLYPSSRSAEQQADTTLVMPSGETLISCARSSSFGVLSQHLKFPCQTKACKLYNVQIVLSALSGLQGITSVVKNVRSEDVVDGHREKTIILLWSLVGTWGLEALVDKIEVMREIRRLESRYAVRTETDSEDDVTELCSSNNHGRLLQTWAKAVARKHGLKVRNLSTCFADGKVFRCIVDEYQPFIARREGFGPDTTLETKLKGIGCSQSFASMFGCMSQEGQVFGKDFTIAALAFLCSRLLGASKKRRVLAGLAFECMKVVVTRNTVVGAAVTLQQAWRAHMVWKTERLREQSESVDFWLV
ncbi:hypothetical protein MMC11_003646 [Xylographa trunciseda]|nr:hypothetical protein [Xylographa trunciseda]